MSFEHSNSRMAYGKARSKLFVFFTCIVLTECRSLIKLSGTEETKDGWSKIMSENFMPDHEGFDESLADFEHLRDDAGVAGQLVTTSVAAWDAMSPKLRCGEDLMKLQLSGPEVAQIELCRDNSSPVPLTNLPPHCGQTIPTYEVLVYVTPYDGCGVMQQGGSSVMQIQWQGNSAIISCPIISTTANEALLGPNSPTYLHILLHRSPLDVLSSTADTMQEPSTETGERSTPTSQEMLKPQPPGYSQAFLPSVWPYYHPNYHYPGIVYPIAKPTGPSAVSQVSQVPTQNRQLPIGFYGYTYNVNFDSNYSPTTATVAQDPTQKPQLSGYPQEFWPFYYPHYHPVGPKPWQKPDPAIPTAFPSSSPATTQEQQPLMHPGDVFPQYNDYPNYPLHWQLLYLKYQVQPPKTPAMPPNAPPQYYIPPSSMLYEKDPFALQFVDLSEIAADSFP